jgi:hypothetical protein
MKNKWAVVVVERYTEDVSVRTYENEDAANKTLRELWKSDIATETDEAAFNIDFAKSKCEESFAELYYENNDSPIRYFVTEISDNDNLQKVKEQWTDIGGVIYKVGDRLKNISWTEGLQQKYLKQNGLEVIAIGEGFIGIVDSDGIAYKVTINSIIEIKQEEQ